MFFLTKRIQLSSFYYFTLYLCFSFNGCTFTISVHHTITSQSHTHTHSFSVSLPAQEATSTLSIPPPTTILLYTPNLFNLRHWLIKNCSTTGSVIPHFIHRPLFSTYYGRNLSFVSKVLVTTWLLYHFNLFA